MSVQSDLGNTDVIAAVEDEQPSGSSRTRAILMIVGIALATIIVAGVIALGIATSAWIRSGKIAPGVTIAGLDVSGMTEQEAISALQTRWVPTLPDAVTVTFPGGEWEARREELGVRLELQEAARNAVAVGRGEGIIAALRTRMRLAGAPAEISVPVQIDEETLEDAVGGLAEIVDRDPVDADIKVVGSEVEIIPGKVGRTLDINATMNAISEALGDPGTEQVAAVVNTTEPSVTAEDLSHIEVVLGEYSTPYRASQVDRTHNLALAASKLNEVVIHPGERFSFNETVGERLVEDGYRAAPIFINGDVEPSTGGGICQVATTTYNAALLANLDMIERHHHSRPVDYAPTGRDATVYWGQYDLKFRNNLSHPVLMLTDVSGGRVTIRILGAREDDADVEIIREGLSRVPHEVKEVEDPELEAGETEVEEKGRDGWRVTVYRRATRDGKVIRNERLHRDYYAPQTEVIRVGTKPKSDEGQPEGENLQPGEMPTSGPDAAVPAADDSSEPAAREISPGTAEDSPDE